MKRTAHIDLHKLLNQNMGIMTEILKNKEEILVSFLKILEGKETSARVDLHGVEFEVGKNKIKLGGAIEFTFVPVKKK